MICGSGSSTGRIWTTCLYVYLTILHWECYYQKKLEKFKLFKLRSKWAKGEIKTLTKSNKNVTIGLDLNRLVKTWLKMQSAK